MADETKPNTQTETTGTQQMTLLDRIVASGNMARDVSQQDHARALVAEFAGQVAEGNITIDASTDLIRAIKDRIAQIDEVLSAQLNAVMHAPEFQKLEASWRGLNQLVMNSETGEFLKIRLMNMTFKELVNDMEKAIEFDQSIMFKQIYEEEYGTFGGNPYSCLIGDFQFGRLPQHIKTLEKMSGVAAAAHAPFIAAADPKLFDMDSFNELGIPRDLTKIFESSELAAWASFRKSEDSRYVSLTLPHVLTRLPYGPDTTPVEEFDFREDVDGMDPDKYLWGNSAYSLAQRITSAFAQYHWCAAIRGVEGGGLVEGLPAHTFKTPSGDTVLKCPTETAITDRREKELSDLGFLALCHRKGSNLAAFFGGQTTNKPEKYNLPAATANARISAMLPYILAASRFAHYIKSIMRDKIGSFMTRDNVANYLNTWISQYVLLNDDAPQAVKARFPLREARVDVTDVEGKPGAYKAVVFLKPHFQLDELTVSIRLVAELPPPAAA